MSKEPIRAEILVQGLVQGVGFRYFVFQNAQELNLCGYVKNLYTGDVQVVVEGGRIFIEELIKKLKIGPMHSQVRSTSVKWSEYKNEFSRFEIKY